MKLKITLIVIGVVLLAAVVALLVSREPSVPVRENKVSSAVVDDPKPETQERLDNSTNTSDNSAELASGRYADFDDSSISAEGYANTILFFHASWCPECRAFEQAIESSGVPDGVQILKVDYDTSQDLRSQYGVTVQTTFVRVDSDGNLQKKWVGYGEDKSTTAIIENTA